MKYDVLFEAFSESKFGKVTCNKIDKELYQNIEEKDELISILNSWDGIGEIVKDWEESGCGNFEKTYQDSCEHTNGKLTVSVRIVG